MSRTIRASALCHAATGHIHPLPPRPRSAAFRLQKRERGSGRRNVPTPQPGSVVLQPEGCAPGRQDAPTATAPRPLTAPRRFELVEVLSEIVTNRRLNIPAFMFAPKVPPAHERRRARFTTTADRNPDPVRAEVERGWVRRDNRGPRKETRQPGEHPRGSRTSGRRRRARPPRR